MTIEGRCQENRISNENHRKLIDYSCIAECLQKIKTAEEEEDDEIEELRREFEIAIAEDKENMNALKKKSVMESIKLSSKLMEEEGIAAGAVTSMRFGSIRTSDVTRRESPIEFI